MQVVNIYEYEIAYCMFFKGKFYPAKRERRGDPIPPPKF